LHTHTHTHTRTQHTHTHTHTHVHNTHTHTHTHTLGLAGMLEGALRKCIDPYFGPPEGCSLDDIEEVEVRQRGGIRRVPASDGGEEKEEEESYLLWPVVHRESCVCVCIDVCVHAYMHARYTSVCSCAHVCFLFCSRLMFSFDMHTHVFCFVLVLFRAICTRRLSH